MNLFNLDDLKNDYKNVNINVFLRCDVTSIKEGLNLKDSSDQEIFTKLRDLKDTF